MLSLSSSRQPCCGERTARGASDRKDARSTAATLACCVNETGARLQWLELLCSCTSRRENYHFSQVRRVDGGPGERAAPAW